MLLALWKSIEFDKARLIVMSSDRPVRGVTELSRTDELRAARRVFVFTLFLNLGVALSKLIWGFSSHTLSMVADGFHSLLDASANIVGIVGITISSKPPDTGHPYGHRKFEALAAIFISFLMFLSSYEILSECLKRLLGNQLDLPVVSPTSYAIMLVTMFVNIFVSKYEAAQGKKLHNELLIADSKHTLSDVGATIGVLVSLLAVQFKFTVTDLVASLLIVAVILRAGFGIIMTHLGSLVDAAIIDPTFIERLVLAVPGVTGCHKIRSRGMRDSVFIDLHVQVSPHLPIEDAHEISSKIEEKLRQSGAGIVDVLVHIENSLPDNPNTCHEENG
jgi:cation diffusion facilitator family transporter